MKIAIVHDSLSEFGGAERVLQILLELFPNSDVYTGYFDSQILKAHFPTIASHLKTTLGQQLSLHKHTSLFQLLSPLLWSTFDFSLYDLIISNSAFINANIINTKGKKHIQFIQSPPKNIFDLDSKTPLQRIFPYHEYLAPYIKNKINTSSTIIVNSKHMKIIVDNLYGINSTLIYPPVKIPKRITNNKHRSYFLIVSRLDRSKSIEIAIEACNKLNLPLKIVGKTNETQYEKYLRLIAGPSIEFLGFKSDKEIIMLYKKANAFIFTAKNEDFGIAPIEAMGYGLPVIAYYGGGVRETVVKGKTGLFFKEHNAESLAKTLCRFQLISFNSKNIHTHARKFSVERFKKEFFSYLTTHHISL